MSFFSVSNFSPACPGAGLLKHSSDRTGIPGCELALNLVQGVRSAGGVSPGGFLGGGVAWGGEEEWSPEVFLSEVWCVQCVRLSKNTQIFSSDSRFVSESLFREAWVTGSATLLAEIMCPFTSPSTRNLNQSNEPSTWGAKPMTMGRHFTHNNQTLTERTVGR